MPDTDEIYNRLRFSKDSATGRDGIPYSAYKALPDITTEILCNTIGDMALQNPITNTLDLNEQLIWFAPKGQYADDGTKCVRHPANLRTIFGSNTDSKIIAGTNWNILTPGMLKVTPAEQRGFCHGRQLALNIVDLDAYMRVFNDLARGLDFANRIAEIPAVALYDYSNAFPTLAHEWIFLVLRALGIPGPIRRVIYSLYSNITAFSSGADDDSFLFHVLGGVRTGCPLSSILFVLCVNPILHLFLFLSDWP